MGEFASFSTDTIDFLWALRMNNSKQWMDQNRDWYQRALKEPTRAFAKGLEEAMGEICREYNLVSAVSRINRDIRYSKDKSPYKDRAWVVLKTAGTGTQWKNRPAFFFELCPEGYTYGCGCYCVVPSYMADLRKKMDADMSTMKRLASDFNKQSYFQLETENYKRLLGEGKPAEVMPWYQAKSFVMIANHPLDERFYSPSLFQEIAKELSVLFPLYRYLQI